MTSLRVLIVDDDRLFAAALTRRTSASLEISVALDAKAARESVQRQMPDLAIVDLFLGPGHESGLSLIRALRRQDRALRIVATSALLTVPLTVEAVHAGANDAIPKPFAIEEIIAKVEPVSPPSHPDLPTLGRVEWEYLQRVLATTEGNRSEAARRLKIPRFTLQRKLRKAPPRR